MESGVSPGRTPTTRSQKSESRRAIWLGFAAVLGLWSWQALTVHYNYGGNWTALFRTRPGMPVPDFLKSEKLYIFESSPGYDGQVFHLMAHDPWMRRGARQAIAGASFRYQRILVPALAWIFALGRDRWIDASYFAVILGFVFLGVYWLARVAARAGLAPAWGLMFALTPAAITSIDRMTVDVALAAFTAGFAWYAGKSPSWRMALLLACAALTRETALPVIAGYALYLLTKKQIRAAARIAASSLPAVAWFVYLNRSGPPEVTGYLSWVPLGGFIERVAHPAVYALAPFKAAIAQACDYLALAGIAIALVVTLRLALARRWDAQVSAIYALAIAAILLGSRGVWEDAEAFGRVLTPLLLLLAIEYLGRSRWLAFAPMLMVDARIGLNLVSQFLGVIRGLTGLDATTLVK